MKEKNNIMMLVASLGSVLSLFLGGGALYNTISTSNDKGVNIARDVETNTQNIALNRSEVERLKVDVIDIRLQIREFSSDFKYLKNNADMTNAKLDKLIDKT